MEDRPTCRPSLDDPTVARDVASAISADDSDGEFEFSFVTRDSATGGAPADELFSDGRIRAFYPVFGRVLDDSHAPPAPVRRPLGRLFLEEARNSSIGSTSSSSSSAAMDASDLDGVSPDSYCVWMPGASPASSPSRPPRKSGSTGSMSRWRRVSELVIGRSHSDGREKFLFLSAPPSPAKEPKGKPRGGKSKATTELDTVAASHRMFYGTKSSAGAARRTFLPYRQDLVGLFSNAKGISRSNHHPF